ncbi:AraC family transcriptional regulator [Chryseobacterium gotjawalense]|uniref:AraC family transcriptional regulator n=1 Tax=Chryseobacterium gotjawalense TaxID=3042315 RepID=A0ABY8RF38_9FLAO|nr:AraC family transcriptional regulator [Chryseobacterium sp. wdc7]WHF51798.1 AraC family transcriptional regulator [Chryseobacterium sp. wdc7]
MLSLRLFILLLLFTAEPFVAQCEDNVTYQQIRKQYQQMEHGDPAAIPFIGLLITLTKEEKNSAQLTYAYLDALKFHPTVPLKLKYADSAIAIAHRSGRSDLIGEAYMSRGIVTYAHYRNYQAAMEDYLKAADYAKISGDPYLQYRLLYQFGVVKGYMGLHQEATDNLKRCAAFFRKELHKEQPGQRLQHLRKNYYDSLHELVNIYQQTDKDASADRLIEAVLKEIPEGRDFAVIRSCFLKSRGISEYNKGNYKASIGELDLALPELIKAKDFAWVSVIYYYKGNNAVMQNRKDEGVSYFKKMDSVFQRHHFIFPELQHGYHYLIREAGQRLNFRDLTSYMDALRAAETVNHEDWHHLYARFRLASITDDHQNTADRYRTVLFGVIFISLILAGYLLDDYLEKPPVVLLAGGILSTENLETEPKAPKRTPALTPEIRQTIRNNLRKFEEDKAFLAPNLSLKKVAQEAGVNANYLSRYLNSEKGMSVSRYLAELRIAYIAGMMAEDPAVANRSAEQLCALCGIASPSNMRHLFYIIYGMPLSQYQKQCREKFAGEMGGNEGAS